MKLVLCLSVTAVALPVLLACQYSSPSPDENVRVRQLLVVDSIGVEYGESCEVFGNISGAVFINDSTFVVLDKGYQELRVFDTSSNHLITRSSQGNGPLEYRSAEYIAVIDPNFALFEFNMPPTHIHHYNSENFRNIILPEF
ncbi:MAG: hypothetical protein KAR40_04205 [Candidatus Sabulitectum sp.]|nr:hypothetical protein [Candidatus Sabulitectum sp.]